MPVDGRSGKTLSDASFLDKNEMVSNGPPLFEGVTWKGKKRLSITD